MDLHEDFNGADPRKIDGTDHIEIIVMLTGIGEEFILSEVLNIRFHLLWV